ncbi:hypothetical protein Tco_1544951, partial [Tanacetum coccineum]
MRRLPPHPAATATPPRITTVTPPSHSHHHASPTAVITIIVINSSPQRYASHDLGVLFMWPKLRVVGLVSKHKGGVVIAPAGVRVVQRQG